ncbi:MAG: competence/damage-inducible protein A [Longimicrobiales bacterium]
MNAPDDAPGAVVVTVGDELLSGRTIDTNAAHLGRVLGDLGIPVLLRHTVGDRDDEIRRAVADGLTRADLVVVSGGLGPTPDDLTREAVAGLLGRRLLHDEDVLERIRVRFREAGREDLPDPNRRVAQVPEGARVLPNPVGTAPGLVLEREGRRVLLLPGVPGELRALVDAELPGIAREVFGDRLQAVQVRQIHTTGVPESALAQAIGELLPEGADRLQLAFLPDRRGVDLRMTAVGMTPAEAAARFDALERTLAPVIDPWRFDAPDRGDLVEAVLTALRGTRHRVAVAESCTGGLIAKRLTDEAGASDVVVGGVVAYDNDVKEQILGVPSSLVVAHGAVSGPVARAMAEGVARRLGASASVAVTGVAGPGGGTPDKPVGTVWYAVSIDGRTVIRHQRFAGDRDGVRERSAQAALALLLDVLRGRVTPDGD